MIEYLYGTWLLCLIALLVYVLVRLGILPSKSFHAISRNAIKNCFMLIHTLIRTSVFVSLQHKMFYKTKSTSRQTNGSATVTTQNDGLSKSNIQNDPMQSEIRSNGSINFIGPHSPSDDFSFWFFRIATILHLFH